MSYAKALAAIFLFITFSHAATDTPPPAQDFIRAAAMGRGASDLSDLAAFNQALEAVGVPITLPTLSSTFAGFPVDYRSISSIGKNKRLSDGGLLTGYDLCAQTLGSGTACDKQGSLGYGLCVRAIGSPTQCKPDSTLGYGLCVEGARDAINCDAGGSLGYGICAQTIGQSFSCDPNGTLGYALCVKTLGQARACRSDASQSYGLCVLKYRSTLLCQ